VLTIQKCVKKNFHLWTLMIFVISTNNIRMLVLIDNDFNQNFIDQRFVYKWRLKSNKNSSINSSIMNDTSLRVFKFHFLKFSSEENNEKIFKIKQNLMFVHMMSVDVILRMFWLKKMNFQMNWMINKWRFRKNLNTSSNNLRVVTNKQKSKNFENESSDFYIIQMSWLKLQFILSKSKTLAFATLFNLESKKEQLLIVIEKTNENNNKINNEISFQYIAFQDIFFEIKTHKFSKHDFHDHVIEILSNRDLLFDLIYNLSTTKLKILKNYINDIWKRTSLLNSNRLRKFSFSSLKRWMTNFVYA
jgi:hypothetical protein